MPLDIDTLAALVASVGQLKGVAMKAGQLLSHLDLPLPPELRSALTVLQPVATPSDRPAPPPVSEATPVAVPPATPTALRYYASGNRLWVLDQVVSLVLLAVFLFSGLSARLRMLAQRIGRNWFFTIVVYFALFSIVTFVVALPLTYYEEFVRQHDYGLSNQTLRKWWTDSLTTLAVTCVAGTTTYSA